MRADGDDETGPLSSASSMAMSSLVPVAGKTTASVLRGLDRSSRGAPVTVGVDDDLGATGEGAVRHRVHVADDHVGLEPGLDEGVRTTVDPDEDRTVFADVVAQDLDVLLVVISPDDDEGVSSFELGAHVGNTDSSSSSSRSRSR